MTQRHHSNKYPIVSRFNHERPEQSTKPHNTHNACKKNPIVSEISKDMLPTMLHFSCFLTKQQLCGSNESHWLPQCHHSDKPQPSVEITANCLCSPQSHAAQQNLYRFSRLHKYAPNKTVVSQLCLWIQRDKTPIVSRLNHAWLVQSTKPRRTLRAPNPYRFSRFREHAPNETRPQFGRPPASHRSHRTKPRSFLTRFMHDCCNCAKNMASLHVRFPPFS
jgi:hypothetical protein